MRGDYRSATTFRPISIKVYAGDEQGCTMCGGRRQGDWHGYPADGAPAGDWQR